jgi:DNA-binding transcriptional ArsR family regulator
LIGWHFFLEKFLFWIKNTDFYKTKGTFSFMHKAGSIDYLKLQVSSKILRALVHELRLDMLLFLDKHENINVNIIHKKLNLEQSVASQHLRILKNAGLVHTQRNGKFIHYQIDYEKILKTKQTIDHFLTFSTEKPDLKGS